MSPARRPARILVTGERDAGKTVFCRALVEAVRALPGPPAVAGVVSPRVYEGGEQVGIDVEDLRTGRRRRLATLRSPGEPALSEATKLWRFDEEALAWGNEVLRSATPCDLLVVDELGPLEFEEGRGWLGGPGGGRLGRLHRRGGGGAASPSAGGPPPLAGGGSDRDGRARRGGRGRRPPGRAACSPGGPQVTSRSAEQGSGDRPPPAAAITTALATAPPAPGCTAPSRSSR